MQKHKTQISKNEAFVEVNPFWKFIGNLPVTVGIFLVVFGLVSVVLLLLERYNELYLLGIGLPLATASFFIVNSRINPVSQGGLSQRRLFDILAVVFVAMWGLFNLRYTAQTVYLYRDPGLYNTTARWLIDHDNIDIPAENPFGSNPLLFTTSNAGVNLIKEDPGRLYTHGLRLLPAYAGIVGRLVNEAAALKVNVFLGSAALLAIYGFARTFSKPKWALLVTGVFSLSLPMIYFSRDMYSEVVSMLFFFTLLSTLYLARREHSTFLWGLSGLVAGATVMTRIDAFLGLAGITFYLVLNLIFSEKKIRKIQLRNTIIFLTILALTSVVGWLDLTQLGTAYYRFHEKFISYQILLIAGIVVAGGLAIAVVWKTRLLNNLGNLLKPGVAKNLITGGILLAVGLLLARPLIINAQRFYEVQIIGGTESIVIQGKQTPNSVRYDVGEQVIDWPTWYLGLALCGVALAGLVIAGRKSYTDKNLYLVPFLLSFLSVALLYFWKPSITPDHVWASRRILPVIMPGIAFLAGYTLSQIDFSKKRIFNHALYLIVGIVFTFGVLSTSGFFMQNREDTPLLEQVSTFCDELPKDSAVLLIGIMGMVGNQTIHSYCNVPTVRFSGARPPRLYEFQEFYMQAIKNKKTPIVASFTGDVGLFMRGSEVKAMNGYTYAAIEKVFSQKPEKLVHGNKQIVYGILKPDGTVSIN